MISLKTLLRESQQLTIEKLSNILRYAYISIFDVDDVEIVKAKDLLPPSFSYLYMTVSIVLKYKGRQFLNYHKLFHYKFPKEELEGLSSEEWRNMLKYSEQFPHEITTDKMLKGNNNLIVFNSSVNDATNRKKITGFEMHYDLNHLGDVDNAHNVLTLVEEIKNIIDKYGSDSDRDEDESPIITSPTNKLIPVNEGSSIPGALEGWLDTSGVCWYVKDTHGEWAARYFKEPPPDESDAGAWEASTIRLKKALYDKGWARVVIKHDINLIYFDTFDTPWQHLTRSQRSWLYSAAIHGVEINGDKIVVTEDKYRRPNYRLQFGGKRSNDDIDLDTLLERKK